MKYALVVKHLEGLGNGTIKPIRLNRGICQEIGHMLGEDSAESMGILVPIFRKWKHFSGNAAFPIPHHSGFEYKGFYSTGDKWDSETEYGKLRLELCLFIAEELRKL